VKHAFASRAETRQPFGGHAGRDAGGAGCLGNPPTVALDPVYQKGSTMHRHAGMLVDIHPGAPVRFGWLRSPSLTSQPRMNNRHSFDS
jgi:hypothetical protein